MFNQSAKTTVSPAPLPEAELERCLQPFGLSRMLPKAAYLDPAVLAWEHQNIFSGWICLGRSSDVAETGAMKSYEVAGSSVLLVRDAQGDLRCFENACRHRGHELLPCGQSTQGKAIICPYHAWAYDFDGSLRGAPLLTRNEAFNKAEWSLHSVPAVDWHGWAFVDPSGSAGDFADHVADLEPIVDGYDAGDLQTAEIHEYDVAANWKIVIENYQECYHCPSIHPELCAVSPPRSGDNLKTDGDWVAGWMDLRDGAETMSLDGRSNGVAMARLDEHEQRTVMYIAVMPNLLISLHPDYVMTHLLTPLTAGSTRIQCSWAFPPAAFDSPDFDPSYAVKFWDLTNRQDWAACESVQRGMATPSYVPGPLAPDEDGVYQFVTKMARRYLGMSTTSAPSRQSGSSATTQPSGPTRAAQPGKSSSSVAPA
jgi:Rieske 2Fe-2S family protein